MVYQINRLKSISMWHFVWIALVLSELATAVMSLILKGKIDTSYLITAAVVSLIVSTILIYLIITERKRSEAELKRGEKFLQDILDSIQDGISVLDKDMNITRVNTTMEKWYADNMPLIGKKCYQAYHGRSEPCKVCPSIRTLRSGKPDFDVVPFTEAKGVKGWLELYCFPLVVSMTGETIGVIEYVRDITERKHSEEALRKSEARNMALLNAMPDMIFRINKDGVFIDYNAAQDFMPFVPPEKFLGAKLKDVMPDDVAQKGMYYVSKALQTGEKQVYNYQLQLDGNFRNYEARLVKSSEDEVIAIIRDTTEQRKLEDQLRHSQKMEAVGTLTAGIAHEYYNVITAIRGGAELIEDKIGKNSPLRRYLDMIYSSIKRATRLTESLLTYSRKQIMHLGIIDINETLMHVENLLIPLTIKNVKLKVLPSNEELRVKADRNQIEQVLLNLAINAMDAMPKGGTVTISIEPVQFHEEFVEKDVHVKPGKYALISVRDTGSGMDKKTEKKIFEPFFTTKDIGKGTGLGLSMAYGIIKKHNGYINVFSELGKGTTFKIYLPAV